MPEEEFDQRMRRIEELVREFEAGADPAARDKIAELLRLIMEFHGAAVERMTEIVAAAGETGGVILERFARDELVASLLLLYGLHPSDAETRVRAALDKVRPLLSAHALPTPTSSRRSSSPAATSGASPSTARLTTSR